MEGTAGLSLSQFEERFAQNRTRFDFGSVSFRWRYRILARWVAADSLDSGSLPPTSPLEDGFFEMARLSLNELNFAADPPDYSWPVGSCR